MWFLGLIASLLLLGACSDKQPPNEVKIQEPAMNGTEPKEIGSEVEVPKEKADVEKLKEHIQEQELRMEDLNKELDYYKKYIQDLTLTLSSEKLQELIDQEWNYSLTVNSIQFPKNGILEISQSDFELLIQEKHVPYSVLPEEESIKGKIPSELIQSLTIKAPSENVSSKTDDINGNHTLIYSFKGLAPDEVIKITLSEELAKKMEMSTVELEIRITE